MDYGNEFENEIDNELYDADLIAMLNSKLEEVNRQCNDDYIENPVQKMKLIRVFIFLMKIADVGYDTVFPIEIEPRFQSGEVAAKFTSIQIMDEQKIKSFSEILQYVTNFSVIPTDDNKLLIEFVVPNVFVRKNEK